MVAQSPILKAAAAQDGMYYIREAARYSGLPTRTVSTWLAGEDGFKGETAHILGVSDFDGEPVVSFEGWAQTLALAKLRTQLKRHGVSIAELRRATLDFSRDRDIPCPLVHPKSSMAFYEGGIYFQFEGEDFLTRVSGKRLGQTAWAIITYDEQFEFVENRPVKYEVPNTGRSKIVLDPKLWQGEPTMVKSGYRAQTLHDAAVNEGGVEAAAEAYDVDPSEVKTAFQYIVDLDRG